MRKLLSFFPPPLFVPIFTQTRFKQINKQTHRESKRTNQSINHNTAQTEDRETPRRVAAPVRSDLPPPDVDHKRRPPRAERTRR